MGGWGALFRTLNNDTPGCQADHLCLCFASLLISLENLVRQEPRERERWGLSLSLSHTHTHTVAQPLQSHTAFPAVSLVGRGPAVGGKEKKKKKKRVMKKEEGEEEEDERGSHCAQVVWKTREMRYKEVKAMHATSDMMAGEERKRTQNKKSVV